ncbi:MAG: T9SS type A sorting domain-containing protein [Aureispira sp.]|nr:T9SS type A sorting domain-containing protein [Aureispira sp.]
MKHIFKITLVLFLLSNVAWGQINKDRDVIGSAGNYSSTPTLQVAWTVGEVAVTTETSGNLIVTQGFQQEYIGVSAVSNLEFAGEINVFPNPVADVLNFRIEVEKNVEMVGELFDATGKKVYEIASFEVYDQYQDQINFSDLPAGNWFLRFVDKTNNTEKTFTIVKAR